MKEARWKENTTWISGSPALESARTVRNAAEVKPAANTAKIDAFKGADGSGMATSATPERAKRNRARSGTAKGSPQSKWEANPDRRGWNLRGSG